MTLVVDASVVVKWFVEEEFHDQAVALLDGRRDLHAPDFLLVEMANVAWKKVLRNEIENVDAHEIAHTVAAGVPLLHVTRRLNMRALEIALALEHPVYDCLYLALAETLGSVVVTADGALVRRLDATPFAGLAAFLPDWVAAEGA